MVSTVRLRSVFPLPDFTAFPGGVNWQGDGAFLFENPVGMEEMSGGVNSCVSSMLLGLSASCMRRGFMGMAMLLSVG